MKKSFTNTRVTVRLRKSDYYDEWYLYLEAYPVQVEGKDKPQRVREYINRSIKTPIWDKSRTARTGSDGKVTYKPKRDLNGIILCKSELDQENCLYADRIRRNTTPKTSILMPMQQWQNKWRNQDVISSLTSKSWRTLVIPIMQIVFIILGSVYMNY